MIDVIGFLLNAIALFLAIKGFFDTKKIKERRREGKERY